MIVYKTLFKIVVVSEFACGFVAHQQHQSRSILNIYFIFILFCSVLMFIYYLLKTINWTKIAGKVYIMLFKYSLSQTFWNLYCKNCIYTSLTHWNACLILEKHVWVLFEGDILLTAWLRDPLISPFSWFKDSGPVLFCQCDPCSGLVLVFKTSTGFFFFFTLSSPAFMLLSIGCICEHTITCWRNNKPLLGTTSSNYYFQF